MPPAGSPFPASARRPSPLTAPLTALLAGAALLLAASLAGGCSSVNEINVGTPRPAALDTTAARTPRTSIAVELRSAAGAFPEGVRSTRFRVREIWLRARDGAWTKRLAASEPFRVDGSGRVTRTLLATEVPAADYDSLALFFEDIYIEYGPTAGGIPTLRDTNPLRIATPFTPASNRLTTLRLDYAAPASITQDTTSCRWTFRPEVAFREAVAPAPRMP